jgi:hypothetical protein
VPPCPPRVSSYLISDGPRDLAMSVMPFGEVGLVWSRRRLHLGALVTDRLGVVSLSMSLRPT